MSTPSLRSSANTCVPALVRLFAVSLAILVTVTLATTTSLAQCTLSSPDTWSLGASGNWSVAGNWSGGVPNGSSTNTCITDGSSTVSLDMAASVGSLQLGGGNVLNFNPGAQLSVYGPNVINAGAINVNGGGGFNTYFYLPASVTLSGGGTLTLSTTATGGGLAWLYLQNSSTLDNVNNTIQGEGLIYNNGTSVSNEAGGTINANSTGGSLSGSLTIQYGTVSNAGLLEASNNGTLVLLNNTINNAGGNITGTGSGASVDLESSYVTGGTFNSTGGAFVGTPTGYGATLDGSTGAGAVTINGTYTIANGSNTQFLGSVINNGILQVNGGAGTNSYLYVPGNVTLTGGGTVNLSTASASGGYAWLYLENGATLDNVNNTIQGEGLLYNNGTVLNNHVGGIINANSTGSPLIGSLTIQYGTVNNAGLLEATKNGTLQLLSTTVNNAGGNITASGSGATVVLESATVNGGTLNNNGGAFFGTPAGSTANLNGPVTINGTYTTDYGASTYLTGSMVNNNRLQVNGGNGTNSYLYAPAAVTLTGGGTVNLSSLAASGGYAWLYLYNGITLDNVNNTIQGEGVLYNNGTIFNNHAAGVINANSAGSPLINALALDYGTFNNTGLIEATNNGALQFYSTVVNNTGGGVITASGPGTSVTLVSTTIQGGTLNNNGAAFFGTPASNSANLDGSTGAGAITLNGTYTTDFGASTYLFGSIVNNSNLQVNGGNGTNAYLDTPVNVALSGGGTVSLNTLTGNGNANLYLYNGITLDNVNNTIQGEGVIYNNGTIFNNHVAGLINANSTGGSLATTLSLQYGTFNNQNLIEANNSGNLQLYSTVINNTGGGVIAANGAGTSVDLYNTTIQGGTLNNNGASFFGTPASQTNYLDGSTTAGAVTLKGTYTTDYGASTVLHGTMNNQGNLQVNGGNGTNTYLDIPYNVTLTGGGTVSLSTLAASGGNANLQVYNGVTLDNINNTIQGEGIIYNNGTTVINEAAGTILANSPGGTLTTSLTVQYGTVTNNGTLQAEAGNLLHLYQANLTNFSGNTLTGGTYNIYGTTSNPGTLQADSLGNTGGEIVNNAATILLNGPNSNFVDQAGLDALSNFSNNTSTGSFTIQAGRNFTSPSSASFANAGAVTVGTGSTFTTGGTRNYNQSGGSTQVDGALVAGGGQVNINAGTLRGNGGTITGNVLMAGTIAPGDAPGAAGQLNIVGNYVHTAGGIFQLDIGGLTAGSQFDVLNVSGLTSLSGTLNIGLINSFFPTVGDTFIFLTSAGGVSNFFSTVNGLNIGGGEQFTVIYNPNNVEISTILAPPTNDYWNGGTGNWSNGAQWSLGTSPGSNNDAFIYSGGNDLVTLNVGSTTVDALTVGGAANGFTSQLTDGGTAQNLNILKGLTVGQNGVFSLTGGSTVTAGATSFNAGAVSIGTPSSFSTTGGYFQSGGSTKVDGSLSAGGNVFINGGTLLGNGGKITGNVTNAGTVSPGDTTGSAGKLAIAGNYVQTSAGIFQLNIGGLTAGSEFDLLAITQMATLSGTLDISLINSFLPSNGQIFTFLTAGGGVNGIFGTVNGLNYANGHFTIAYNSNSVQLDFVGNQTGTPEPGTLLLLGSGMLSLSYGVRRRIKK